MQKHRMGEVACAGSQHDARRVHRMERGQRFPQHLVSGIGIVAGIGLLNRPQRPKILQLEGMPETILNRRRLN